MLVTQINWAPFAGFSHRLNDYISYLWEKGVLCHFKLFILDYEWLYVVLCISLVGNLT